MDNPGVIPVGFETLKTNYPVFKHLPKPIQDYMDDLNKNIEAGKPKNTPCCIQICHALNMSGQTVWPRTSQRRNAVINGRCYIGNVRELEEYLTKRYGQGQSLRPNASADDKTREAVIAQIRGRYGILLFRDKGYGMHTELWDNDGIVQSNKNGGFNDSVMNEVSIFKVPRILFWAASDSVPLVLSPPLPDWLAGWWDVYDGNQYYYYFSDDEGAVYTTVKPTGPGLPSIKNLRNGGVVSLSPSLSSVTIEWSPATQDGATTEVFTPGDGTPASTMNGTSNRYGPLRAVKMN